MKQHSFLSPEHHLVDRKWWKMKGKQAQTDMQIKTELWWALAKAKTLGRVLHSLCFSLFYLFPTFCELQSDFYFNLSIISRNFCNCQEPIYSSLPSVLVGVLQSASPCACFSTGCKHFLVPAVETFCHTIHVLALLRNKLFYLFSLFH